MLRNTGSPTTIHITRKSQSYPSPLTLDPNLTAHLLEEVQADNQSSPQAWIKLLERCESRLRVLAHFRMQGRSSAHFEVDDLLQEVWIEASHRISDFEYRGSGSLQRWLSGILHYKLLEAGRASKRLPFAASAIAPSEKGERAQLFEALSRTQPGASTDIQHREMENRVNEVLEGLAPELREAILLRIYESKTGKEAAEGLGISESAFSKRFRKALAAIRVPLREEDG